MEKAIFISIKPQFTKKIEKLEKNYEYRNYIPKEKFKLMYVYETLPTGCLKYIMEIDEIVEYPNKILENKEGNKEFNNGNKSKYAYHILHVYKLDNPITLNELKNKFKFIPPQGYAYDIKYEELANYIKNLSKTKII